MGVDEKGWPTGPATAKWPRLSETLTGPRRPDRCQSCGITAPAVPEWDGLHKPGPALAVWQEMGDFDQPTLPPVHVVLCRACADRLIEPHPRLYAQQMPHKPMLGVMALCVACEHRDGLSCASPLYGRAEHPGIALPEGKPIPTGWAGLVVRAPEPSKVHIYRRGKGARSGWETYYPGPPTSCSGRETLDGDDENARDDAAVGRAPGS